MLKNYICNIPYSKTENCIIINARDWIDKSDSALITNKKNTGVQVVDGVGYTEVFTTHNINTGDEVLITKVASQIAYLRPYEIPDDDNHFPTISKIIAMQHDGRIYLNTSFNTSIGFIYFLIK